LRRTRCLRSTQNFDAVQVEELRLYGTVEQILRGHGNFIDVDAHGRGTGCRTHAANLDIVEPRAGAGLEGDARHSAGDVIVIGDVMLRKLCAANRRHADRNVLDVLRALLRSDDDLRQLIRRIGSYCGRHHQGPSGNGRANQFDTAQKRRL